MDTPVAQVNNVACLKVFNVRMLDELLQRYSVDGYTMQTVSVQLQMGFDVAEQLWCKAVHFEQLFFADKTTKAVAISYYAPSKSRAYAMEQH